MYLPSVAGVELAKLLSLCLRSSGHERTVLCQRILPSVRFRQISNRSAFLSLVSTHVVRNTRSPWTIGDEWPTPGISVFQAIFSVADQWIGNAVFSSETPSRRAPRHMGQSSAKSGVTSRKVVTKPAASLNTDLPRKSRCEAS